jgi:hypothetical protein
VRDEEKLQRIFVIIDDMLYDKEVQRGKVIKDLHYNGRHFKIFLLTIAQDVMNYKYDLRGSVDYVFAFEETNRQNREKLYKQFFGVFPDFATFDRCFSTLTESYSAMVINNKSKSKRPEDCVHFYRAKRGLPVCRAGNRDFWKLHFAYIANKAAKERAMAAQAGAAGAAGGSNPSQEDDDQSDQAKASRPRRGRAAAAAPAAPLPQISLEET